MSGQRWESLDGGARAAAVLRHLAEESAERWRKSDLGLFRRATGIRPDDERLNALDDLARLYARRWKPRRPEVRRGLWQLATGRTWTEAKVEALKVGICLVGATPARRIRRGPQYIAPVPLALDDVTLIEADWYIPQRAIHDAEEWVVDNAPWVVDTAPQVTASELDVPPAATETQATAIEDGLDASKRVAELFELGTPAQCEVIGEMLEAYRNGHEEDEARQAAADATSRTRGAVRKTLHDLKRRAL